MQALFFAIFAAVAVIIDQITKYLVLEKIPLYSQVDVLPGVV